MTYLNTLKIVAIGAFTIVAGFIYAQNTNTVQPTLNYDATNGRIGINTASPRATLEVSGSVAGLNTLLIAPSTVTPTATVTGTIAMNSNGKLATLTNTTTGVWTSISTPTTVTFVPAN